MPAHLPAHLYFPQRTVEPGSTPRPNSSLSFHIGRFPGILFGIGLGQTFRHRPHACACKAWVTVRLACDTRCACRCASLNAPSQNVDVSLCCVPQAPFRIAYCLALPRERSLQTSAGYITFPPRAAASGPEQMGAELPGRCGEGDGSRGALIATVQELPLPSLSCKASRPRLWCSAHAQRWSRA